MSYETRMYCRLLLLPAMIFAGTLLACYIALTFTQLPSRLGGAQLLWPDLPIEVYGLGTAIAVGVFAYQMFRGWQWFRGAGIRCLSCDCLMIGEKDGPYGTYRKCLGCGKNQSL